MNARPTWVLGVAVVLAAFALGAFLGPRTQAQKAEPLPEAPPAVRYVAVPGNDKTPEVVVIDTATGHCWSKLASDNQGAWTDLGSPAQPRK